MRELTPDSRDLLIEVMAMAIWGSIHRYMPWEAQIGWVQQDFRAAAIAAIAAAERAGFKWEESKG